MDHVVESQQFDRRLIQKLFDIADAFEHQKSSHLLEGRIMASLFYEPSTRTRLSFESAMLRLGGEVIGTENAREFSSTIKGESLEDTIRVISGYADVIVLRHFEEGASAKASHVSTVPIINAGDGAGQHPTQSLLDLYTLKRELGNIDGTRIALLGDLKNSRTVRSLAYLLGKYKGITIDFVSPKALAMKDDIKEYLDKHKVTYTRTESLETVIQDVDAVYQTRVQKERFKDPREAEKFEGLNQIDMKMLSKMKRHAIIMDPLPRVGNVFPEVDASPKAAYFRQAQYGLYVRMAILKLLFEK